MVTWFSIWLELFCGNSNWYNRRCWGGFSNSAYLFPSFSDKNILLSGNFKLNAAQIVSIIT
jgi:hypothetical protein